MSIFKNTIIPNISASLDVRQKAMKRRTPQDLQYINSRNAWVRMTSGVGVYNGTGDKNDPGSYTNDLAKKYVLLGGTLYESAPNKFELRSGVGGVQGAYSNISPNGFEYNPTAVAGTAGIRPMPGITGLEIKSKSAYGSLREATVTFMAWSIQQLEDLEILYMRPGYTVLIEWGWVPHLDLNGNLVNNVQFYDDVLNGGKPKELIWRELFAKATNGEYKNDKGENVVIPHYNGNYDSVFGYVKNYQWTARADGGYECQVTLITIGEVIESLKINYSSFDNPGVIANGLIASKLANIDISTINLSGSYSQNILAGLFTELYGIGLQQVKGTGKEGTTVDPGISYTISDPTYPGYNYDFFRKTINIKSSAGDYTGDGTINKSDEHVYIRLESLVDILNNYIILKDKRANKPFVALSVKEREYDKPIPPATTPPPTVVSPRPTFGPVAPSENNNPLSAVPFPPSVPSQEQINAFKKIISGEGYLKSLAHPLTLSVDPTVCLVKNKLWTDELQINVEPPPPVDPNNGNSVVRYDNNDYTDVINEIRRVVLLPDAPLFSRQPNQATTDEKREILGNYFAFRNLQNNENVLKEIARQFVDKYKITIDSFVFENINNIHNTNPNIRKPSIVRAANDIIKAMAARPNTSEENTREFVRSLSQNPSVLDTQELNAQKEQISKTVVEAKDNLDFLNNLAYPYFTNDVYVDEIGIIGNIYINVGLLYEISISTGLEVQDRKEKNDIALYDFIKTLLSRISTAIGNVNNFDLYVDPVDGKARIIDINYVDSPGVSRADVYANAFEFQIHNLNSTVRSYNLQSQIFPEQSTIIAIGAQVNGGALGTDTSTLVDFNRNIIDRIIPEKTAPTSNVTGSSASSSPQVKIGDLSRSLGTLYTYFQDLKWDGKKDSDFNIDNATKYQNALKDIINFFRTVGKSNTKNRAIIPTKLSLELDGIGGLVIGHIFKIPSDLLPKGYKGGGVGSRLGYIITGIAHSLQNNDWVTKLDAQTIILDEPEGEIINWRSLNITPIQGTVTVRVNNSPNVGNGEISENNTKYPLLVKKEEWKKEYSATLQKNAKVSAATPIADSLRKSLNKQYITEKGGELSSNGDITENLKNAVLNFQSKLITNRSAFGFIKTDNPIVITAGNDTYHRTYSGGRDVSTHGRGLAIDIRTTTFTPSQIDSIMNLLRTSGFAYVTYHGGSALHIHANVSTD